MLNDETNPTASSGPPAITDAGAPFNYPDAEIILRSSDQVDFRVFKLFLSLASPVFKDMFATSAASTGGDNSDDTKDGLPIIPVTERGAIRSETLLIMCYPMAIIDPPVVTELKSLHLLLGAAIKYDVQRVEKYARGWLVEPHFLATDPLWVFAIACRWNLEEEARVAAKFAVGQPILERPLREELDFMTARQLYGLLQYNGRCTTAMKEVISDFEWIDRSSFCWFGCGCCEEVEEDRQNRSPFKAKRPQRVGYDETNRTALSFCSGWWERYMRNIAGALANQTWNTKEKNRLMEKAVQDAKGCKSCRSEARSDLQKFGNILEAKMDEVVSKARVFFSFAMS